MERTDALIKFAGTDTEEMIYQYKDADKYCIFHADDPDLWEIWAPLPIPPSWDLIDGFGLEPEEQKFSRQVLPPEFYELEAEFSTLDEIWEEMRGNPAKYSGMIDFIQRDTYYELNGYWFFCNGKPTYISGYMYVLLNYWKGDEGYLEYRDRDRKWFAAQEYLERLANFIGMNTPKPRRTGDTTKASLVSYVRTSRLMNANSGLQSCTLKHGGEVFANHVVLPWQDLPFWRKPLYDTSTNPKEKMAFVPPAQISRTDRKTGVKGSLVGGRRGLGSKMVFGPSNEGHFDTWKLHTYHGDEVGKTIESDIYKRFYTIRPSLSQGDRIFGWCMHTSTVNEQTKEGGANFKRLCDESMFEQQYVNESHRTTSWLANIFLPADEGLDGFVGPFGESIKDTPTLQQVAFMRERYPEKNQEDLFVGATEYILRNRRSFEQQKNFVGLNKDKRLFPLYYRDCWVRAETDNGMPINVVESRIADLSLHIASEGDPIKRGRLVRIDQSDRDSDVIFVEDDKSFKFELSLLLDSSQANKRYRTKNGFAPARTDFGIGSSDDFSAKKTEGARMSDGGGSVFMFKTKEDSMTDNIELWTGHRFICLYKYRPSTTEEYGEDMIMMCQYFGVPFFPENNLYVSAKYFIDRGYGPYLKYEFDLKTRRLRKNAGWPNTGDNPQRLWRKMRDHFTLHGHREMHLSLLKDVIDIPGIEYLTDYDRFVAAGGCLLGAEDFELGLQSNKQDNTSDITKFFSKQHSRKPLNNRKNVPFNTALSESYD